MEIMEPSYYAIIPAEIRYSDIPGDAKLLYGEITALTNHEGYCWASNTYFSGLYKTSDRTIRRWLNSLEKIGAISIENNDNTRKIFLVKGGQKCPGGRTKMSGGADKNVRVITKSFGQQSDVYEANNTINITKNSFYTEKEKIAMNRSGYVDSFDDFIFNINKGALSEKYPWKNIDECAMDCFIFYETNGRMIRSRSCQIILDRWIRGRDPKVIARERIEYENRKNNRSDTQNDKNFERKIEIADKFIQDNPQLIDEIDRISMERAKKIARGNDKVLASLSRGFRRTVALEMADKTKNLHF